MPRPLGSKNKSTVEKKPEPKAKVAPRQASTKPVKAAAVKEKPDKKVSKPVVEKKKPVPKEKKEKPAGKPLIDVLQFPDPPEMLPCLDPSTGEIAIGGAGEPADITPAAQEYFNEQIYEEAEPEDVTIDTLIAGAGDVSLSVEVAAASEEDTVEPSGKKGKKATKSAPKDKSKKDISIPALDPSIISCLDLQKEIQSLTLQEAFDIQQARRVYQTGCVGLDIVTNKIDPIHGNGGLQELGIYEVYGRKGVRKSNFWELFAKYVLDDDPTNIAVFLYTEDPDIARLKNMGLPVGGRFQVMGLYNPATPDVKLMLAEQRLMDLCAAATHKNVKLIVIDSLKALVSMTQMFKKGDEKLGTKPIEDDEMAIRAKLMEKMLNRLLGQRRSAILGMTNHMIDRIPNKNDRFVIALNEQDRTPAGTLKEFLSAVRIKVDGRAMYEESKVKIGAEPDTEHNPQAGILQIYTVRHNRWGRPKIRVVAPFDFGEGPGKGSFDRSREILTLGVHSKLINQEAATYHFLEGKVVGKEKALLYLDAHLEERESLYRQLVKIGPQIYSGNPSKHLLKAKVKPDAPVDGDEAGIVDVEE